jgi:hypothetical protein
MAGRSVLMTYALPEQLRVVGLPGGREVLERVPKSPTRPARATDVNVWREDVDGPIVPDMGAIPRDMIARDLIRNS